MASSGDDTPSNLKIVVDDDMDSFLTATGSKLVVVDFSAVWCGPCQRIGPYFSSLAKTYPEAIFLKCDVEDNPQATAKYGIRNMPTFIFIRSKAKIDEYIGAQNARLKAKLDQWYTKDAGGSEEEVTKNTYMDLATHIEKKSVECLNESNEHDVFGCLAKGDTYLESDCDEQLIINVGFSSNIRLHSLKMTGELSYLPKTVKIFTNLPNTIDFDTAERSKPVQELQLTKDNFADDVVIPLSFVKFQNVSSVMLFVKDNQGGEDTTKISHLAFIGMPVNTTNMGEFKRITGNIGESH